MPLPTRPTLSIESFLRIALWSVLLAVVAYTRTDPDLWGHVRFGLDVLHDGTLQKTDPYSFTSDREWINHEWAAETLSGITFAISGSAGLVLLKLGVIGATLLLLNRALLLQGVVASRRRDWLGAATVITTVQQAHHVRPQIFSLLFFALLLTCLMTDRRRSLLAVPPLFALWANFHGGWIVGGGVLVLWTVGSLLSAPSAKRARLAILLLSTGVASLAATLVNPYRFGLWRFLWDTVGLGRADISDWQPVHALDPTVWALWIVTATLATLGFLRGHSSLHLTRMLIVAALAVGSFFVNRLLGFFALSTAMLFGAALVRGSVSGAIPNSGPATRGSRRVGLLIGSVMVVGGLVGVGINLACIQVDPRTAPEPEALVVLKSQQEGNRLLVWFDWGEYAIWHLAPAMRVSIDGRRETVYSASLQNRHLRFFFDAPGGADLVQAIAADYVWIPAGLPAAHRLRESRWTVLFDGEKSVIFARPGITPVQITRFPGRSRLRCFPNP
jgi:hypothetical protein